MTRAFGSIALAAAAAVVPTSASAAWVGLDDGQYLVNLTCTVSQTLDCSQSIQGSITVQGSGLSEMNISVGGLDFVGDPVDNVVSVGNDSSEGSYSMRSEGASLSLRLVTSGTPLGFTVGERFWAYCSDLPNTQNCLLDTSGTWTATRIGGTVSEPPALAAAVLGLALAFSAGRRRRRAAGPARPTAA